MEERIREVICEFIAENYGDTPEDACYNITELAKEIASAICKE